MRYAIYYTPAHMCALERLGAAWLGRDAFTGAATDQPAIAGVDAAAFYALTEEPRRYGFHATLKGAVQPEAGHSRGRACRRI